MDKLKKTKFALYASIGVIVLVVLVGIGVRVSAFIGDNNPTTVMEKVTIDVYNEAPESDNLSAMASPDIPYHWLSVNGDRVWHIRGKMQIGTTSIVAIDPSTYGISITGSTTVVDTVRLRINTVATSTFLATCGASESLYTAPTYDLMTTGSIATSTGVGCVMENTLLTADNGNSGCADGGTINKITLTTVYPYFTCVVTATDDGAFTDDGVLVDIDYLVRFSQMQ